MSAITPAIRPAIGPAVRGSFEGGYGVPRKPAWPTGATFYDYFNRSDGPVGTSTSGKSWVKVPLGFETQVVEASIQNQTLVVATPLASPTTAAYSGVDLGGPPQKVMAKVSWAAGGDGSSLALISNKSGLNTINDITSGCVHIVFSDVACFVEVWESFVTRQIGVIDYPDLEHDGTIYDVGWSISGNTITIYKPDGTTQQFTDAAFSTQNGRYVTWEHFRWSADLAMPVVHRVGAS